VLAALAVLAGCGAAAVLPGATARDFPADACSLVPEPELAGLGLTGPGRPVRPPGIGCRWDPATSGPGSSSGVSGPGAVVPVVLVGAPEPGDYRRMVEALRGQDGPGGPGGRAAVDVDVAGRTGVQLELGGVGCSVVVDLDPGVVVVTTGAGCDAARAIAGVAADNAG